MITNNVIKIDQPIHIPQQKNTIIPKNHLNTLFLTFLLNKRSIYFYSQNSAPNSKESPYSIKIEIENRFMNLQQQKIKLVVIKRQQFLWLIHSFEQQLGNFNRERWIIQEVDLKCQKNQKRMLNQQFIEN
ncbi:unnamed protein product (macronuclear) [Paramecium tetraurelia]|uniref:Transmembrane protein n=1 Tax=Paramecium tetraurelia TaxID=5888 RepID=A0BER6_PARTE|nr:uncharacterized protein GSPATT00028066001 [Paramecium tetraurelia]CAK57033.1 unnamed protein product [Paramecium tetraurelia]|eukprot:XP_001424431.1 hypothetical protein (macronuclear) [Paramecium tetraurelia strain d4-2]